MTRAKSLPAASSTKVAELYGLPTFEHADWNASVSTQQCPFLGRKFDHLSKHLVLVLQDHLLSYMQRAFAFNHIHGVRSGDPMHFHAYELRKEPNAYTLRLKERLSTDAAGVAACLGLQVNAKVDLVAIIQQIEGKLPQSTLLTVGGPAAVPIPEITAIAAGDDS